jgi:hypothetical protein
MSHRLDRTLAAAGLGRDLEVEGRPPNRGRRRFEDTP